MDELADQLEMDPVELRRRNPLTEGTTFATGEVMYEAHWDTVLDKAAAAVEWSPASRSVTSPAGRRRGKGLAVILKSTITPSTTHAAVRLDADGTLQVFSSAVEMGQGAHTVLAQLAADAVGISVEQVHVTAPDTQYTPYDQTMSSSRTTRAMGGAVTQARRAVRDRIRRLAADLLEEPGEAQIHGLGETGLPPVIAAIGNAVANATGHRVRRLPITPERVLDAMEEER